MTMARKLLVDVSVTRFYHCISRCVRKAFLCGEGCEHRKQWLEDRLELLAENFAVSVCGFSLMDHHLHVLVRLDPGVADGWSDEEVVRRWIALYPPRTLDVDDLDTVRMWVEHERQDAKKVAAYRQRLQDLGWFMKSLKEPLARLANKEDDCNLLLVDYTSRVVRNGTARVSAEVAGILERLNTSVEFWSDHIQAMFDKQRILGSYFSTTRERLRTLAAERGVHHLDNAVSLADR